jgi:homoaconitate hydratase
MGQTIVEKITELHLPDAPPDQPIREGDFVSIWPRHVMTHDNTSAVLKKFRKLKVGKIRAPRQPVFCLDHDIQNRTEENLAKYRAIEGFAREQGLDFYPAGSGIGHQLMVEQGYVLPGSFVVASDSHSNMYGALGAVGTPVVRTDAAIIWATGEFWWQVPRTIQVVLEGSLARGVTGKDVIIALCGLYNREEVLNAAVEFAGTGVLALDMEARLTIANMTTEWGALVGWFPVDEVTLAYLERRRRVLEERGIERITEADLEEWRRDPPAPDPDAVYAARIVFDLDRVTPHVSGPDSVQVMVPLSELKEKRVAIQKAYIVSCVNSRLGDLQEAARVLKGKKVAPGVSLYVAAASREVEEEARALGAWDTLLLAGAKPLLPGCGPCIGLGEGLLEAGEVGLSATNRNFKGRMGSRDARCYLASPAVVAASAVEGYITGPDGLPSQGLERRFETLPRPPREAQEKVDILEGFPAQVRGRLVFLTADNLNTDGIYGKDYTYREDMTPEAMARVVMENYDPTFAARTRAGDVLVGGANFGTGSSREQAVTALQAKGFQVLVAASYSQTYLRNAFNNGYICVECPDLVAKLKDQFRAAVTAKEKVVIPGEEIEVDFSSGRIRWRGEGFSFPILNRVPQSLVVAGGVEKLLCQGLEAV